MEGWLELLVAGNSARARPAGGVTCPPAANALGTTPKPTLDIDMHLWGHWGHRDARPPKDQAAGAASRRSSDETIDVGGVHSLLASCT